MVGLLDNANMEAVIRDFGDRNPQEDPVIHFYELFLKEYDAEKRMQRGVFYTPRPVVSYIVRSVDELLRTEFGLVDGLADTTTWGEMVQRRKDLTIPEGISPDQDFVQVLDPATGTGTFLVEVIDVIYDTLVKKWRAQGLRDSDVEALWNEYVPRHLLPRLHGYELLMAPYAIAHLKIGLKLYETGYRFGSEERAQAYLTNAMEPAHDFSGLIDFAIPALAYEAQAVNEVKDRQQFTVVIGNPPYSGHSANRGTWISELIDDYKRGFPELKKPAQAKWLQDDYVKFLRFSQWKIEQAGRGIVGMITNHSYLDNPTFRGMRQNLMHTFDDIYILDLHGSALKREACPDGSPDKNVFDIRQGVAIAFFVKHEQTQRVRLFDQNLAPGDCTGPDEEKAIVYRAELYGTRESKYDWLDTHDLDSTEWYKANPGSPLYLFVSRDEALNEEYEAAWSIPEIFSLNGDPAPGIVTTHDQFAISWTKEEAVSKVERLLATKSEKEARGIWRLCSQSQWRYDRAKQELADDSWRNQIKPILYRPFDIRTTVLDRNVAVHRRERVMRHMLAGPNVGLVATRQVSVDGGYSHVLASRFLVDNRCVYSSRGIMFLMPLYLYSTAGSNDLFAHPESSDPRPNLNPKLVAALAAAHERKSSPEETFHYIYAVLYAPSYREKYEEFLRIDFPHIPFTADRELFAELAALGARLVDLHLLRSPELDPPSCRFEGQGDAVVARTKALGFRYDPGEQRLYINRTQYFGPVPTEVYKYRIGGYQVCDKWLKDRKERCLELDDIRTYCRMVTALGCTLTIQQQINALYPDVEKNAVSSPINRVVM